MLKSLFGLFKWRLIEKQKLEEVTQRTAELQQKTQHREQGENVLRHHLHQLDVLLNTIPDPVYFQDIDGVFQGCNLSFANIVGLPRESILGRSIIDLHADCQHRLPEKLFQQPVGSSAKSGVSNVEGNIHCADDRLREFLFSKATIVEPDGKISGSVGVMVDITERKKAEADKERLIKELQEALATVKTLHGLLPICSFCKKIRDDKGYWNQIETYVQKHSNAQFSHSVCQECAKEHYPGIDIHND